MSSVTRAPAAGGGRGERPVGGGAVHDRRLCYVIYFLLLTIFINLFVYCLLFITQSSMSLYLVFFINLVFLKKIKI